MDEVADLGRTEPLVTSPPVLPRPPVDAALLDGVHASIERLDADRHARDLWDAIGSRTDLWSEVPPGPFMTEDDFKDWLASRSAQAGQALYAIVDRRSGRAAGLFLVLRIDPAMGTLEIGLVYGSPKTSRSRRTVPLPARSIKVLRTHQARQAAEALALGARWP